MIGTVMIDPTNMNMSKSCTCPWRERKIAIAMINPPKPRLMSRQTASEVRSDQAGRPRAARQGSSMLLTITPVCTFSPLSMLLMVAANIAAISKPSMPCGSTCRAVTA